MTKLYKIEKKTPSGNRYPVNIHIDADTAPIVLTEIIYSYDSMAELVGDRAETESSFANELYVNGYVATTVDDDGDTIHYYIVAEED